MRTILLFLLSTASLLIILADEGIRAKRNYYGYDYGYGVDGDFWYAGRILGIILGISLLLLCCCLPCVCIAGIWFLGWFGLRQRRQRKAAAAPVTTATMANGNQTQAQPPLLHPPSTAPVVSHPIRVDTSPPTPRRYTDSNNVIYSAEERYYTSSAPSASDRRPDMFRASRF